MNKARIFNADSAEKLEKDINKFLSELTNAVVVNTNYVISEVMGTQLFSCLIVYRIENEGNKYGLA